MADLFGTPTTTPTLEAALMALARQDTDHASERNDVGYNGSDTTWGNRLAGLAAAGRLRWRDRAEYRQAHERLRKYARQLRAYGVEFDLIPNELPETAPDRTHLACGGGTAAPALQTAQVPGRCWTAGSPPGATERACSRRCRPPARPAGCSRCGSSSAPPRRRR